VAERVPKRYRDVLKEQRRRLRRLAERGGVGALKKIYEEAIADLERRLAKIGPKSETFSAHQHRMFLGQLRQGLAGIVQAMSGGMADISRDVQVEALRGVIADIGRLEKGFTGAEVVLPIEEAARFQGVVAGVRESMLRAHEVSVARYGSRLIRKMEDQLSVSLLTGEDLGTAIDRITKTAGQEWWKAEEIARTETLWSFNATQHQGMKEAARELPDLMMRWTEHVSDTAPHGLDDRVDVDSIALHGQVAPPGGVFRFPSTLPPGAVLTPEQSKKWPSVQRRFAGQSWAQPPNRPNDRSSLAPWRPHWGVPGWQWVGGRRVVA
jgi:hypothetical protein